MRIKTIKEGLLIGDRSYSKCDVVEVPDAIGRRLLNAGAAVLVTDPPATPDEPETATLPPAPSKAAKRT